MKNPVAVQINSHYGYISIAYFDENLTKIEALVGSTIKYDHNPSLIAYYSRWFNVLFPFS